MDYQAERPFKQWKKPAILRCIDDWLGMNPPRLELATLALEELKARGAGKAKAAHRIFNKHQLPPIPWLASARNVVRKGLPKSTTPRGRGRLYVVLRHGYSKENGYYGAYVGVTSKAVEKRFVEHRTGVRSARGLPTYGIELLYSLFDWANPIPGGNTVRQEAESRLHRILANAVPRVSGDVMNPKQ